MSKPKGNPTGQYKGMTQRVYRRLYVRRIRAAVIAYLGGKCSDPNCRWMNEDGTMGCKEVEMLQVDHVNGGGSKERKSLCLYSQAKRIMSGEHDDEYQMLCANCNWKKKHLKKEVRSKDLV